MQKLMNYKRDLREETRINGLMSNAIIPIIAYLTRELTIKALNRLIIYKSISKAVYFTIRMLVSKRKSKVNRQLNNLTSMQIV
jgi:hypothetical protein